MNSSLTAKNLKWCFLTLWLLLFPCAFIWRWSYLVLFPLQVIFGIAAVSAWILACRSEKRGRFLVWSLCVCSVLIVVLVRSIFHPANFTKNGFAVLVGSASFQFARILDSDSQQPERYLQLCFRYRDVSFFEPAGLPWKLFWFDLMLSLRPPRAPGVTYFPVGDSEVSVFSFEIPLWTVIAYALSPALVFIGLKLKGKPPLPQACSTCGYDLRSIGSPLCPECGATISEKKKRAITEAERAKGA